jgi:hypothetical protein
MRLKLFLYSAQFQMWTLNLMNSSHSSLALHQSSAAEGGDDSVMQQKNSEFHADTWFLGG